MGLESDLNLTFWEDPLGSYKPFVDRKLQVISSPRTLQREEFDFPVRWGEKMPVQNQQGLLATEKLPSTGWLSSGSLKDDRIAEKHSVEGSMLPFSLQENLKVRFPSHSREWGFFTLVPLELSTV